MVIDVSECEPDAKWLSRFNTNIEFRKEFIHSWRDLSHGLLQQVRRVAGRGKRGGSGADKASPTFEVPDLFDRMTGLLVLWCDTSRTSINPDPFYRFRDFVHAYALALPAPPAFADVKRVFERCHRLLKRIILASCLAPTRQTRENQVAGNDVEGKIEDVEGEIEADNNTAIERTGVYGLIVNAHSREIRRKGHKKTMSLAKSATVWHVFRVLFDAGKEQALPLTRTARPLLR